MGHILHDWTLDEKMIQLAGKFLSGKRSSDEAKIKELIAGLKGVYVKVFEFDKDGEYSDADLDPLRAQLRASGWTRASLAGNVVDPEFVRNLPPRDKVNWRIDRQALTATLADTMASSAGVWVRWNSV